MDDLVVIILTLIIAGVGILGQVKKRKQGAPLPEGEKKAENIWDLIQQEINPVQNIPQPEYIEDEVEEAEEAEQKPSYEFEVQNEGSLVAENKMEGVKSSKKLRKIAGEKFSLRKAVIYSEILNRKYT